MPRRRSIGSLVVVALGGLLGCATSEGQLHRKAQRTLAREDPRGLGSPALARDANPHVRVETLRRMQKRAAQLDDAGTAAAAAALDDDTPAFDEPCRGIIDAPWGQKAAPGLRLHSRGPLPAGRGYARRTRGDLAARGTGRCVPFA